MSDVTALVDWMRVQLQADDDDLEGAQWEPIDFWWLPGDLTPERLRAEVAAKRAILDRCVAEIDEAASSDPYSSSGAELAEEVIRLLAQPFASRPGFRPEWAVVPPG